MHRVPPTMIIRIASICTVLVVLVKFLVVGLWMDGPQSKIAWKNHFCEKMATHRPTGLTLEVVGIESSSQGRSCESHATCGCLVKDDVLLRLRKVQVLIEGKEEPAIAAYHVMDGVDTCRVGFLKRHLINPWEPYFYHKQMFIHAKISWFIVTNILWYFIALKSFQLKIISINEIVSMSNFFSTCELLRKFLCVDAHVFHMISTEGKKWCTSTCA